MKTKSEESDQGARSAHFIETLVGGGILLLMVILWLGADRGHPRPSKRRVTEGGIVSVQSALDRYFDTFGEYPEPVDADQTAEIEPGRVYRIGGARCLYQAMTGDGNDAIKTTEDAAPSDGRISPDEMKSVMFKDMPSAMWRKIGSHYILVDGFGRPFQYTKAGGPDATMNTTYDLWSFAEDDKHLTAKSPDARGNTTTGIKWIKNW